VLPERVRVFRLLSMLQAIIWDFDGVIVDSEPAHYRAFLAVVEPMGITFDYETYLKRYVGYDDRDGFDVILRDAGQAAPDESARQDMFEKKADAFDAIMASAATALPGSLELVKELHGTLPQAIASGATQRDIKGVLEHFGLVDHFPVIVAADDVERSKPDPTSYRLAVQRLAVHHNTELAPADCLAIEDTAAGVASASGAGLMTLGLTTTGSADTLRQAQRVEPSLEHVDLQTLMRWYG